MTRRDFFTLFAVTATQSAATPVVLSSGLVSSADHELSDGWFAIAQQTAVRLAPDSPGWLRMRELRGRAIELMARTLD